MYIVTLNVNGLRSAERRGFSAWLARTQPDVLLLQEVRAMTEDLPLWLQRPPGYHVHWHPAEKPGYAGTAIWSRHPGEASDVPVLPRAAEEGRLCRLRLPMFDIYSAYFPSGSSGPERQAWKMEFLDAMRPLMDQLLSAGRPVILGGDVNIAHTPKDIKNAKANEKNSGFLPEERAWLDALFATGWRDLFREVNPEQVAYSWWSNRGRARENDVGWRIDYLWATPGLPVERVWIERDAGLSDHAPVHALLRSGP